MMEQKINNFIYTVASFIYASNANLDKKGIELRHILEMSPYKTVEEYENGIRQLLQKNLPKTLETHK